MEIIAILVTFHPDYEEYRGRINLARLQLISDEKDGGVLTGGGESEPGLPIFFEDRSRQTELGGPSNVRDLAVNTHVLKKWLQEANTPLAAALRNFNSDYYDMSLDVEVLVRVTKKEPDGFLTSDVTKLVDLAR